MRKSRVRNLERGCVRGLFCLKVFRGGKLVETYNDHNLIVDGARQAMARLLSGEGSGKNITSIAFGTSGAVPTPGDTVVTAPFVKPLTGFAYSVTEQGEP
jgi:hypothetical protein